MMIMKEVTQSINSSHMAKKYAHQYDSACCGWEILTYFIRGGVVPSTVYTLSQIGTLKRGSKTWKTYGKS